MPGERVMPVVVNPEVKREPEKYEKIRKVENLAYDFMATSEEMYSILDEVNRYFDLKTFVDSEFFQNFDKNQELYSNIINGLSSAGQEYDSYTADLDLPDTEEELNERIKNKPSNETQNANLEVWRQTRGGSVENKLWQEAQSQGVNKADFERHFRRAKLDLKLRDAYNYNGGSINFTLEDFVAFFQESTESDEKKISFRKLITRLIGKFTNEEYSKDYQADGSVEGAEYLASGRTAKIKDLFVRFKNLVLKSQSFSDKDFSAMDAFFESQLPEAKASLQRIKQIKRNIIAANEVGGHELLSTAEERAAYLGADAAEIEADDDLWEEAIASELGVQITFDSKQQYEEHQEALGDEFITAYITYRKELSSLYHLLVDGEIVETDYVKGLIEEALEFLKKDPPTIVYFHGDFGSGKTALAKHIAITRLCKEGKRPVIVAGSKHLEPDKFLQEFKVSKLPMRDFLNKILRESGSDKQIAPDASNEDILYAIGITKADMKQRMMDKAREEFSKNKKEVPAELEEEYTKQIDALFGNTVEGRYVLGKMLQAMIEGVPLIIDEANAISPDVLIALNDFLNYKIGHIIHTDTDIGDAEVARGYCIMWTGNTGSHYSHARFNDIDPATLSRIHSLRVKYLPNATQIASLDKLAERLNLPDLPNQTFGSEDELKQKVEESHVQAKADQIFQVLLLSVMNRHKGAELMVRADDEFSIIKDLYRLAVAARRIMDVFEGNTASDYIPDLGLKKIIGGGDTPAEYHSKLQHANISMRELMDKVISAYLDRGMDIEYHLFNYVKHMEIFPEEQAIVYAILRDSGFFMDAAALTGQGPDQSGWPDITGCSSMEEYENKMKIDPIKTCNKYKRFRFNGDYAKALELGSNYRMRYFSSVEMLQLLFGHLPARKPGEYMEFEKAVDLVEPSKFSIEEQENIIRSIPAAINALLKATEKTKAKEYKAELDRIMAMDICKPDFLNSPDLKDDDLFAEADKFATELLIISKRMLGETVNPDDIANMSTSAKLNMATNNLNSLT